MGVSTALSLGQDSAQALERDKMLVHGLVGECPCWARVVEAQSLGIHAGGHPATHRPGWKVLTLEERTQYIPVGWSPVKDKPKAPSYGSQRRSLGGEELSRASREWLSCGSHGLLGGGGPHTHTTRCYQAGKASWQWAHPGWAAALSAARKLLIMGEIEKNKTRCFLEHFWHS